MADYFVDQQISTLPHFNRLNDEQRSHISNLTQMLRFQRGGLIFRQNDPTQGMYFIVRGSAQLVQVDSTGQPRPLGVVGALQYFNEAALIQPGTESAALRALEDSLVLLIPREPLVQLLLRRPDIARAIPLQIQLPQQPAAPPPQPGFQQPTQPQPDYQQPGFQQPAQPTIPAGQRPVAPNYQQPGFQQPAQPTIPAGQNPVGQQPAPPNYQQPDPRQPGVRDRSPVHQQQPGPRTGQPPATGQSPANPPQTPMQRGGPKVFRSQRDDEYVLLDTHRHIWVIITKLWLPLLVLVPFAILSVTGLPFGLVFALDGLGLVIAGLIVLYYYLEWRNDHLIVTNQRVLHIERTILTLETSISEVPLLSVQEINADLITANPFSRLFDFGTVELKTAGSAGNIKFTLIPHPDKVQDVIFEYREKQRQGENLEHQEHIREDIMRAIRGGEGGAELSGEDGMRRPTAVKRKSSLLGWMRSVNDEGETIYRKHLLLWMRRIFWPLMLTLLGLGVMALGVFTALGAVGMLAGSVLAALGAFGVYWGDWDWRHDTYVVGKDTIKIIHKRPFWLQNENDQIRVERIDNVISEQGGLIENLFNYGTVRILLLGDDVGGGKYFNYVPNPQEVQSEITRRRERLRQRESLLEEQRRRDELVEYLSVYHQEQSGEGGFQQPGQPGVQQPGQGNQQPPPNPYSRGNFPR